MDSDLRAIERRVLDESFRRPYDMYGDIAKKHDVSRRFVKSCSFIYIYSPATAGLSLKQIRDVIDQHVALHKKLGIVPFLDNHYEEKVK
jgi:hypothetical protein